MLRRKLLRLNLGCGSVKIPGYVNIDTEASCNPDKVCNFVLEGLPYKDNTITEVLLFHCIEHVSKARHYNLLTDIYRVLVPGGRLLISYPEFLRCVENWKKNKQGRKEYWEATIYGLQHYPSDFHVCIMHTEDFKIVLNDCGFKKLSIKPEPKPNEHSTMISAIKGEKFISYEDLLAKDMSSFRVKKVNSESRRNKRRYTN